MTTHKHCAQEPKEKNVSNVSTVESTPNNSLVQVVPFLLSAALHTAQTEHHWQAARTALQPLLWSVCSTLAEARGEAVGLFSELHHYPEALNLIMTNTTCTAFKNAFKNILISG